MKRSFRIVMIKPSHYDDEGYVIRWMWSAIPNNTLACLYGLTESIETSEKFGANVDFPIDVYCTNNEIMIPMISV